MNSIKAIAFDTLVESSEAEEGPKYDSSGMHRKKMIIKIMEHHELRIKLREAGLKRARTYTWENTARKTLQVYRRVYMEQCKS